MCLTNKFSISFRTFSRYPVATSNDERATERHTIEVFHRSRVRSPNVVADFHLNEFGNSCGLRLSESYIVSVLDWVEFIPSTNSSSSLFHFLVNLIQIILISDQLCKATKRQSSKSIFDVHNKNRGKKSNSARAVALFGFGGEREKISSVM